MVLLKRTIPRACSLSNPGRIDTAGVEASFVAVFPPMSFSRKALRIRAGGYPLCLRELVAFTAFDALNQTLESGHPDSAKAGVCQTSRELLIID